MRLFPDSLIAVCEFVIDRGKIGDLESVGSNGISNWKLHPHISALLIPTACILPATGRKNIAAGALSCEITHADKGVDEHVSGHHVHRLRARLRLNELENPEICFLRLARTPKLRQRSGHFDKSGRSLRIHQELL